MPKVYRFRMDPTPLEADELDRMASVSRYIYNWSLERSKAYYEQYGKTKPFGAEMTQLKQTQKWLYDFDSQAPRSVFP